jgi:hypothetical protein
VNDPSQRPPIWYFAVEALGCLLLLASLPLLLLAPLIAGAAFLLGLVLFLLGRSLLRGWARRELYRREVLRRVEGSGQVRKPECLASYQALRFDPTASYGLCSMPLCSLVCRRTA